MDNDCEIDGRIETVICREIRPADVADVAALLTRGFRAWRNRAFWDRALTRLAEHDPPDGLPRMGYALEVRGSLVGVLLMIAHQTADGARYCNLSSWFVEPAFSLYGALLARRALRHPGVTFLNVTPAPETWDLLANQGYTRFSVGRAYSLPVLARRGAMASVRRVHAVTGSIPEMTDYELDLLRRHASWGCISVICTGAPFIFGLRRRRGIVPFAYLLHCRSIQSFDAHARSLGLYLLRYGVMLVVVDAEAQLAGMPCWFDKRFPKFFRGTAAPLSHDLAYTERAIFGV